MVLMLMLGLVGGFDNRRLTHLKDAVILAGSMKWMVMNMYRLARWGQKISPIKNFTKNFVIPHEAADTEAEELNQMRVVV